MKQWLRKPADKEISASVPEEAAAPEAKEPAPALHKGTGTMRVAVAKAVAAAQRAQHGAGPVRASRRARLPLAVVLLILAAVIAALIWWFVA